MGVVGGWGLALLVEGVEVAGGAYGEVLELAFAYQDTGAPVDGVVEGAPGGFDGGQAAQPVGVLLWGEVEYRVGGVQVAGAQGAVGDSGHGDLPEDGGQGPGVAGFDVAVLYPVGVDDLLDASGL